MTNWCGEGMLTVVRKMNSGLSVKELEEVYNFLEEKANKYGSIDGVDRIRTAYQALKILANN
ncbi:MAG: hypothetical protein ACLKAL_03825 [Alkaliphilus sp.]